MKRGKGALLFLVIVGMELSWRYAWANFLTTSILSQIFPFPEAIGTFALASVLTLLSKGKGWRVVYILSIQLFGFILATLRIVYAFNTWSYSFLNHTWLIEFFNTPRGPLEWLNLILVLFLTLMFWVGGVTLARRSTAYSTLCSRFDLGIAAFVLLFLTKFLVLVKGRNPDRGSLIPTFVLSIFYIQSVGYWPGSESEYYSKGFSAWLSGYWGNPEFYCGYCSVWHRSGIVFLALLNLRCRDGVWHDQNRSQTFRPDHSKCLTFYIFAWHHTV